jgi:ubiquinone/menaquinone biosynthesis C-methylase UbiE
MLAERANNVVAVDVSSKALEIARRKLVDCRNVTFRTSDAYDLSSLCDRFEVCFASDWWSHIPNSAIPAFLSSIRNSLKPSGIVIMIDMLVNDHFAKEPHTFDEDNNRISRRTLPDGREFNVVKNFPDQAELEATLTPFATDIAYHQFDDLQRWAVTFTVR